MERFGLVGLPNAGKSSLFNALAGGGALVAPFPFSTTEANVGVGRVPDERLDRLAIMSASKKVVHTQVEFVDIGGIAAGASRGEGLGNRPLHAIRQVDAMVYVLRAFTDADVAADADPIEELQTLEFELALADFETLEKQLDKRRKAARADKSLAGEVAAMEAAHALVAEGSPIYRGGLSVEQLTLLRPHFLLTTKPVLVVVNIGEDRLDEGDALAEAVAAELGGRAEAIAVSVQLEAEAAQLDAGERAELLEGLGLGEGALARFLRTAYHLLGLRTFLTTGDKESRAWTFRAGAKAPEAAGRIHSDLERGFIRAEVIRWDELLEIGSWAKAREVGKLRVEGKDYEVQDGDVLEIRFNV
ncbi:MAG: redox-regulated ATPase YchF [Acidimicrobiales bacterium]